MDEHLLDVVDECVLRSELAQRFVLDNQIVLVDDGQEEVHDDEEHEEDVEDEEGRSEEAVRHLQLHEVEVAQDDVEEGEAATNHNTLESAENFKLKART